MAVRHPTPPSASPSLPPPPAVPPAPAALAGRIARAAPSVLVLGDALLDQWLSGPAHRLGRDAPVPVVELAETRSAPGGAANVAANLAALGARVELVGVRGDDADAAVLDGALARRGIGTAHAVTEPGRHTVVKRRLTTAGQTVARFDAGPAGPPRPETVAALVVAVDALLDTAPDAVVIADYGLGALPDVLRERLRRRRDEIALLVVDAHDVAAWAPLRPDVVTPSLAEAATALGVSPPVTDRPAWGVRHHGALRERVGGADVLLTLDVDGSLLLPGGPGPVLRAAAAAAVPQSEACGAGDTFVAAAALARCVGATAGEALAVAQAAADVVVTRPGTAVCDTGALTARLAHADRGRVLSVPDLLAALGEHRRLGHRVVFTNGCFDVLHRGHVASLRQARELGDVLVVALNSDAGVARLKGPRRPVNPLADRAGVVGAIDGVDLVTSFDEDSPVALLEAVRPEVYAKGGDYTPQMLTETPVVERLGGRVRVLDYLSDHSTAAIVERIRDAEVSS